MRVEGDDGTAVHFRTRATELVFAYLALHVAQEVRRDVLAAAAWPTAPAETAAHNLRTALHSLRQVFGVAIGADRHVVWLDPDSYDVDVERFRATCDPELYRGRLLEDFDGDWHLSQAIELDNLFVKSVTAACDTLPPSEAIQLLTRALSVDPTRLALRVKLRELCPGHDLLQLPKETTQFVGRQQEIEEIERLLDQERWVTVTGPGGCGKTRLAFEISQRRRPLAWFVPLANVRTDVALIHLILESLRIPRSTDSTPDRQLLTALDELPALLVLDNFEHLLSHAHEISALLASLPRLRVLVTSQVPVGTTEEVVYPLGNMSNLDAQAFFRKRCQSAFPGLELEAYAQVISNLCDRLDNYPLALEIAAAKSRLMTPNEMLHEVEDRFKFLERGDGRHGSLHRALDWSFECLPQGAQDLLAELSIFRGSFTRAAVEDIHGPGVAEHLIVLVSSGWVLPLTESEPRRFRLLESVRHFANEALPPARRRSLSQRHADCFLRFAASCADKAFTPEEPALHEQADLDLSNLEAAWEWLIANDAEGALEFVTGLNWFSILRGYHSLANERLELALAKAPEESTFQRAFAYHCRGNFLLFQGSLAESEPWFERALSVARDIDHAWQIALSLLQLAQGRAELGRYREARVAVNEALPISETLSANWTGAAYVIATLVANRMGETERAVAEGHRAVETCTEGGYAWGVASALNELAMAYRLAGDYEASLDTQARSIMLKRAVNAPRSLALSYADAAATHLLAGDLASARANAREAVIILRSNHEERSVPGLFVTGSRLFGTLGDGSAKELCDTAATGLVAPASRGHAHWADFWADFTEPSQARVDSVGLAITRMGEL